MRGVEPLLPHSPVYISPLGGSTMCFRADGLFLEGDASHTAKIARSTRQSAHTPAGVSASKQDAAKTTPPRTGAPGETKHKGRTREASRLNRRPGARQNALQKWHQAPSRREVAKEFLVPPRLTTTLVYRPLLSGSRTLFSTIVDRPLITGSRTLFKGV